MSRRRAPGLAVLSILLSFVASLLVGAAPAHATEVDKTIGFRCSSSFGGGSAGVRVRATIPDQVQRGVAVPGRRITFRIKVPADMVRMMRTYGVDSVSGRGRAAYTIGSIKRPIKRLRIRDTDVPSSGGMTLRGSGRAVGFTVDTPGTYLVKVAKSLRATVTADLGSSSLSAPLTCSVRRGQSRTLASLQVVG